MSDPTATKLGILVANGEPRIVRKVKAALRQLDYPIEAASDGREVLEKLRKGRFTLLILDVMMPYMDGIEVLCALRKEATHERLPVLMMFSTAATAADNESFRAWLCAGGKGMKGADEAIAKPFTDAEVLAVTEQLLKAHADGAA